MNELEAVERIRRLAAGARGKGVKLGIGDDCAIYQSPGAREDLLLTTDMVIEDIHFRASTHPPDAVGWRAAARSYPRQHVSTPILLILLIPAILVQTKTTLHATGAHGYPCVP